MTLTFITNFINHHQVPVADEFYNTPGLNYTFIATMAPLELYLKTGYPDFSNKPYLLKAYENEENYKKAMELAEKSDVVIIGAAPRKFIAKRLKQNKLTFIYSERWFRDGYYHLLSPRAWIYLLKDHIKYRNRNVYMLCASAYTAFDVSLVGAYPNKCFKWGYFTKVEDLEIVDIINQKNDKVIQILWVARFLKLKHPELPVKLAKKLKDKGYEFQVNMVGGGDFVQETKHLIDELGVEDCVSLIGNMSNDEILSLMKQSHIFIFTSDRNEGWGAVLNEAMSNGCAVVASNMIGAAPYLIEHGENGFLFKSLDLDSLTEQVEFLLNNKLLRDKLSINAYKSMREIWSPKNAASNFLKLTDSILKNEIVEIEIGPCCKAPVYNKCSC